MLTEDIDSDLWSYPEFAELKRADIGLELTTLARGEPTVSPSGWCRTGTASGYWRRIFHRRQRGRGPITWLAEGDEMNGLDREEAQRAVERGQRVFTEVFGNLARGFLAPARPPGARASKNSVVNVTVPASPR